MTSAALNPGALSNSGSRHNFKATEDSRPDWDGSKEFVWHKTSKPAWKLGDGAANKYAPPKQVCIDPYEEDRPEMSNYRLITSGVIPRPVAVISTISADGKSSNLSPYSFFQAMSHDPPTFVVGHAMSESAKKDSLKNLTETGECVISLMNEDILEACNAAAVGAPHGTSEWALTGLMPGKSEVVKPGRILEAAFSIECKLVHCYPIQSRARPGDTSMVMTVLEGVRFWVREDVVDSDRKMIDPAKSKQIGRLFGIGYARIREGFQIPWPDWNGEKEVAEENGLVKSQVKGQL